MNGCVKLNFREAERLETGNQGEVNVQNFFLRKGGGVCGKFPYL